MAEPMESSGDGQELRTSPDLVRTLLWWCLGHSGSNSQSRGNARDLRSHVVLWRLQPPGVMDSYVPSAPADGRPLGDPHPPNSGKVAFSGIPGRRCEAARRVWASRRAIS